MEQHEIVKVHFHEHVMLSNRCVQTHKVIFVLCSAYY